MASDVTLARRLGDDYDATVRVSGTADRESETYPVLDEVFELDLSELDADAAQRLRRRAAPSTGPARWAHAEGGHAGQSHHRDGLTTRMSHAHQRLSAFVHGHVQGVGFRWSTRSRALQLASSGTRRTLPTARPRRRRRTLHRPRPTAGLPARTRHARRVDTVVERFESARGELTGFVER